jgi:holin-like protein
MIKREILIISLLVRFIPYSLVHSFFGEHLNTYKFTQEWRKVIRQFGIILAVTFIGEVLKLCIHLPIPASIYGLVIMLGLMMTKIVPVKSVKDAGSFLIEIMSLMFIPAGVGLMISWNEISDIWLPLVLIIIITTVVVMVVTGRVTQRVISQDNKKEKESIRESKEEVR